jgi:DNA-binding beta-propeller fold protein YncE
LLVTALILTTAPSAGSASGPSPAPPLVWVTLEDDGRSALVNVRTERILRRASTPGGPHNITVARDGTAVVALWDTTRIAIIRRRVRFIALGGAPHDVKLRKRLIVVANQGDARIDLVRLSGERLRSIPLRANPHDLAIAPGGRRAWVTLEGSDDLAVVDLEDRSVSYVSTGVRPHDLLFAPDGRLWVTDWGGALHVFNGRRRVRTIRFGGEAHHLAFTPDGQEGWVTDEHRGRVLVFSVRPVERIVTKRIRGRPHHVAITANGRWAVVADHVRGTLVVFNAATHRRVRVIPVGDGPHGVWAVPA